MKYVVVDLEMNPIAVQYKMLPGACKNEIIQIGAVLLDDGFNEIDNFKKYVCPQYNSIIEKMIEKLTGISWEQVEKESCFAEALADFIDWCNAIEEDFQIIQWSENDLKQIEQEIQFKGFSCLADTCISPEKWIDFQLEYGETIGLQRRTTLTDAVMLSGEDFAGRHHDALYDARNTADLLRMVRIPEKGKSALETVKNALKEKAIGVTLGQLFDFEAMCA